MPGRPKWYRRRDIIDASRWEIIIWKDAAESVRGESITKLLDRRGPDGHLGPARYVRRGDLVLIHVRRMVRGEVYTDFETWERPAA